MENKKKNGFLFRNTDRPDALAEDTTPTLGFFFKLLGRKFGKLLSLNLMMAVLYLPMIIALLVYFFGPKTPTINHPLHSVLLGTLIDGTTPTTTAFAGIFSSQLGFPLMDTGRWILIGALLLFTVVTWGWQNVGATYNLRSMVRGDSCFLFSDYFYAIRRNLKQGLLFGIFDCLILAALLFDVYYFSMLADYFLFGVMYFFALALLVLYVVMRFYIYHMMITFELSVRKLLKNALIFALLGVKRNLMGLLGLIVLIGGSLAIIIPSLGAGFSLPLILPIFYLPALCGFVTSYAAFPIIQRYMIDPYMQPDDEAEDEESADEATLLPPTVD